jgi:hypothetical protein
MPQIITAFIASLMLLAGCGPTIYKTTGFEQLTATHKTAAILPVATHIKLKPRQMRKTDSAWLKQEEERVGLAMQQEMYNWFLKRGDNYTISFMDITKTNEILLGAGIKYAEIETKTNIELAELLGVDVVILTSAAMGKQKSDGAVATEVFLLGPQNVRNNKVEIFISAFDAAQGGVVWRYEHEDAGYILETNNQLFDAMMKKAAKKFPYKPN